MMGRGQGRSFEVWYWQESESSRSCTAEGGCATRDGLLCRPEGPFDSLRSLRAGSAPPAGIGKAKSSHSTNTVLSGARSTASGAAQGHLFFGSGRQQDDF